MKFYHVEHIKNRSNFFQLLTGSFEFLVLKHVSILATEMYTSPANDQTDNRCLCDQ